MKTIHQCIRFLSKQINNPPRFFSQIQSKDFVRSSFLFVISLFIAWFITWLFFHSAPVVANDLEEIKTLVDIEVPELALAMIDRHQPDAQNDQPKWLRWEKQRFEIYNQLKAYKKINERIEKYSNDLPDTFYHWAIKQSIQARLKQGDGFGARNLAKKLLWGEFGILDNKSIIELRKLIVTSYLVEGLSKDAYEAIQFQFKEFGSNKNFKRDNTWTLLHAQVLLLNGHAEKADKALAKLSSVDVDPLKLLIKLQLKDAAPDDIIRRAKKAKANVNASAKKNKKYPPQDVIPYWAIIAKASKLKKDYKSQLWALEKVLSADKRFPLFGNLYSANADSLWEAYLDYGNVVRQRLKLNDEDTLFKTADSLRKENMFDARSLYVYLAINSKNKESRIKAHKKFVNTLYVNELGHHVVKQLYLDSNVFLTVEAIPAVVRHMMVDKALNTSDILLASSLLHGLVEVPKEINILDWRLRRARVHILAGKFQQGMEELLGIFEEVEKLNNKQVDRLLQVLFDLQALGKHRAVFPLFEIVLKRTKDKKLKREILYWMADSMKVLQEHAEAARYYLKSAGLTDSKAMDLWAQSARFQAGEALAKAGLVIDAKRVLNGLLVVTKDPGRRALLVRQIDQLKAAGRL